jgi:hypothetical protein
MHQRVFVAAGKLYCRLFHGSIKRREIEEAKNPPNAMADDLIYAANRGDAAALQTLLAKGADVDAKTATFTTTVLITPLSRGAARWCRRMLADADA